MRRVFTVTAIALAAAALAAMPALAKRQYTKVKGEVVRVEEQVRTANGGEFDRLTIRTRNQELIHLDLGPGGACEGCFQAGDPIRARVQANGGPGEAMNVQSLRVRHGGRQLHFVNDGGRMVPGGRGGRPGVGVHDRDRDRDRIHAPGPGGSSGQGAGKGAAGRRGGGF